jgi:hypothetical protein
MNTYLALWPNGTFTVTTALSEDDLFWKLDEEADPFLAKVYALPARFTITTEDECRLQITGKKLVRFGNAGDIFRRTFC